ncbi:MAG: metallophosphoesterase [Candidatus Hydrogenedentes bacterium]|nr:metallophosphoesterase [Candidatus Hydrogenedentota bacterium]
MKKKQVVLLLGLVALAAVSYTQGMAAGGVVFVLFLIGLAIVQAKKLFASKAGLRNLEGLQARYGFATMIARAEKRMPQTDAFHFVVLGDTRKRMKTANMIFAAAKEDNPVVIFHTGDIVRGGTPSEYLDSLTPLVDLVDPIPVLSVPGNHERGAWRDYAGFKALHGGERFTFELGNCLFVGINNSTRAGVTDGDMQYLEQALSGSKAVHKYVFYHIPPLFFEAMFVVDRPRRGYKKNQDACHQLFIRHAVTEVFMAHIHGYATELIDGVRYTLTAGGGAKLSPRVREGGRFHHYLIRHVNGAAVRRELVKMTGNGWERLEEV